jgi:hypothetical protein
MCGRERSWSTVVHDARLTVLVLLLALAGCAGDIGDGGNPLAPGVGGAGGASAIAGSGVPGVPGGGGASGSGGPPVIDDPGAPGQPGACDARLTQRLVLLSDLQHANAVSGALGAAARDPALQLSADTKPFSQKGLVVSTSLVHGRLDQASTPPRASTTASPR